MTNTQAQDATFLTFDDDQALLAHILGITPAEELVDVPEWNVQILCRALSAEDRMAVQIASYDEKTKRSDYRKSEALPLIVIGAATTRRRASASLPTAIAKRCCTSRMGRPLCGSGLPSCDSLA